MDKEQFLRKLDENQAEKTGDMQRAFDHQLADNRIQSLQDTIVRSTNALLTVLTRIEKELHEANQARKLK